MPCKIKWIYDKAGNDTEMAEFVNLRFHKLSQLIFKTPGLNIKGEGVKTVLYPGRNTKAYSNVMKRFSQLEQEYGKGIFPQDKLTKSGHFTKVTVNHDTFWNHNSGLFTRYNGDLEDRKAFEQRALVDQLNTEGDSAPSEDVQYNRSMIDRPDIFQYIEEHNNREGKTLESIKAIADEYRKKLGIDYEVVTSDEAASLLQQANQPYNGEPAFFYKGKSYFVQGQLSEESVIHEFSHPFIDAIEKDNPTLFNNLFNKALATEDGKILWDQVQNAYQDSGVQDQKKELLVRLFTSATQNKNEGKEEKSFLSQLLFSLRQLFRKVFGKDTVNISKIDGSTSLAELAAILQKADKIKLNLESISESEQVDFMRDIEALANEINSVKNGDLVQMIDGFYARTKDQLNERSKNKAGYQDMKEKVVTKGQVNRLVDAASHLKNATKEQNKKQVIDFALSLNAIKDWSSRMFERIGELQSDKNITNQQRTSVLSYYVDTLESWDRYLTDLNKFIEDEKVEVGPEFRSIINEITGQVQAGQQKILTSDRETLIDVFTEVLSGVSEDAQKEFKKAEERYNSNPEGKGAKAAFENAKIKLGESTFDRAEIIKYLRGEAGDSSKISGLFNSAASNGDPIVGGFGTFVRKIGYTVLAKSRETALSMNEELAPLMHLWDRNNPAKSAQKFVVKDERVSFDESGNLKETETYMFLNPFKGYKKAIALADNKISLARKTNDPLAIKAAKEEKSELQEKYFHRQFTDEYYEALKLKQDEIGKIAFAKRDELYEDINREESSFDQDAATEDEIQDHLDVIKDFRQQILQLSSLYDNEGSLKTDPQEIAIAKRLKEYTDKTRKLYEYEEKKGLFESRYNKQKNYLLSLGVQEGSEEFKTAMNNWVNANTRTSIKQDFYDKKTSLTKRLTELLSKLPDAQRKKLSFEEQWTKILDIMKGIKDRDNQPVGSDLNESQISAIREAEQMLEKIKTAYAGMNGLSRAEDEELTALMSLHRKKTLEESERIEFLMNKKSTEGLDKFSRNQVNLILRELSNIQSKIPTDYYKEILDKKFSDLDMEPPASDAEYQQLLSDRGKLEEMFRKSPRFKDWFHKNHIETESWDPTTFSMEKNYKRLYIWDRVIPTDKTMFEKTTLSDGTVIEGIPNYEYFRRKVKDEYITKQVVGKTVDVYGHYLPKDVPGNPYINQDFKNLTGDEKKFLQILTKYHLKAQEGLSSWYAKLDHDIPRYMKDTSEGKLKHEYQNTKEFLKNSNFRFASDAMDALGNFFTADISTSKAKIPVTGIVHVEDLGVLSLDLISNIQRYAQSTEMNKQLADAQPIAKALIKTLEDNNPNDVKSMAASGTATKTWWSLAPKSKSNNRLDTIKKYYETVFEGVMLDDDLPKWATAGAQFIMRISAATSLSLNVPGQIKNNLAANVQNILSAQEGRFINKKEYLKAKGIVATKVIPALVSDYTKLEGVSYWSQMYDAFDPVAGKQLEHIHKRTKGSYRRDFFNGKWLMSGMEFGEVEAGASLWLGMMMHQKVPQTLNGETKEIPYSDAWQYNTLTNRIELKEGIPDSWAEGGQNFLNFKARMHEVQQYNQGNYDPLTQPNIQKKIYGRLFSFMRRYFAPSFMNRFGSEGFNVSLGASKEGYYTTSVKAAISYIKGLAGMEGGYAMNWKNLTDEQKGNIRRCMSELLTSAAFILLLSCLGWNPDDPDKYKKLQENNWVLNHMIYQIMMIKSEEEQFIPIPGMGLDEIMRLKNTPSIAFNHMDKTYRVMHDIVTLMGYPLGITNDQDIKYQRKTGVWDKETPKIFAHAASMMGYTGATLHPEVGIKNFYQITQKTK